MNAPTRQIDEGRILTREQFRARLQQVGDERYHDKHPFHAMLHGGKCSMGQVQAWVLNRFYYQSRIPLKDASLIGRCEDRALRQEWLHRVAEHDGTEVNPGGIARWLKLAEGVGLDSAYVESCEGVLPATKFAVDAYVHFVRDKSILEAVASSLTELFAPKIHNERISGLLQHYAFANETTVAYFKNRLKEAPRDSGFGLSYVLENAKTLQEQMNVVRALTFKTEVLWAQLDALHHAYVAPGWIPPGAFVPGAT